MIEDFTKYCEECEMVTHHRRNGNHDLCENWIEHRNRNHSSDVVLLRRINYQTLKKLHDGEFTPLDYLHLERTAQEVHKCGKPQPINRPFFLVMMK